MKKQQDSMRKFSWLQFKNKRTSHREEIALIKSSDLFDTIWYVKNNPELKSGKIDPVSHYLKVGALAGQDPSPHFSSIEYIRANPDVGAAKINPLLHYIKHGLPEGRAPISKNTPRFQSSFEFLPGHVSNNELFSIIRLMRTTLKARLDYLRSFNYDANLSVAKQIELTGLLDKSYYLETYPEVAASGQDPAEHFARIGWKKGWKPNPDFDPAFYIEHYDDVARLGTNPLIHFATCGIIEGRDASRQTRPRQIAENATYESWIAQYDTITDDDRRAMKARLLRFAYRPRISVIMRVAGSRIEFLRQAVESLIAQAYPHWELCIGADSSIESSLRNILEKYPQHASEIKTSFSNENARISCAGNSALSMAGGDFVAFMSPDDIIPENALFEFASLLNERSDFDILYSDEDHIDAAGTRFGPYFKPDYSHELILSQNLLSQLSIYRKSIVDAIGGFRDGFEGGEDYDLALRMVDATDGRKIAHIPAILYHARRGLDGTVVSDIAGESSFASTRLAITQHLARRKEPGRVVASSDIPVRNRVIRSFDGDDPLISIVVPTKDKADILRICCKGVLQETEYRNIELIIVDHQSSEVATLTLFKEIERDPRVKILPYSGSFNYSGINNYAVQHASGTLLCLLNNDVEVIEPNWLRELATYAVLNDVGAVGAKLLYPDDRIQHGGVVLGAGGVAGHRFHLIGRDDPGPIGLATVPSDISAVTAACLVVKRSLFVEVGGLDADNLPVAFNDVDLCMKIRAAGFRNIYNPYAMLYHHESFTRGDDLTGVKQKRFMSEVTFMIEKWGSVLAEDPFYNPNLDLSSADYALSWPPRRKKPWVRQ